MKYALIAVMVVALTLGVAGTSGGQGAQPRAGAREVSRPGQIEWRFGDVTKHRARIGVVISLDPHETDSLGVLVEAVTPGGPADRAGIRSGDLISKVGGKVIGSTTELPGARLSESLAKLEPHDTVAIEFYRGRNRQTVPVVAVAAMSAIFSGSADDSVGNLLGLLASPLADLSLAPINPELGQYFGATDGVLVINAPAEAKLGLRGGDVILSVDGRKISDPDRILRVLRNHRRQPLTLDVLRNRRHVSIRIAADTTGR